MLHTRRKMAGTGQHNSGPPYVPYSSVGAYGDNWVIDRYQEAVEATDEEVAANEGERQADFEEARKTALGPIATGDLQLRRMRFLVDRGLMQHVVAVRGRLRDR